MQRFKSLLFQLEKRFGVVLRFDDSFEWLCGLFRLVTTLAIERGHVRIHERKFWLRAREWFTGMKSQVQCHGSEKLRAWQLITITHRLFYLFVDLSSAAESHSTFHLSEVQCIIIKSNWRRNLSLALGLGMAFIILACAIMLVSTGPQAMLLSADLIASRYFHWVCSPLPRFSFGDMWELSAQHLCLPAASWFQTRVLLNLY